MNFGGFGQPLFVELNRNKLSQVKSVVDHLFVVVSELWFTVAIFGNTSRAIFGPLPYTIVVITIELLKMLLATNLAILNASYVVQFLTILNLRCVSRKFLLYS